MEKPRVSDEQLGIWLGMWPELSRAEADFVLLDLRDARAELKAKIRDRERVIETLREEYEQFRKALRQIVNVLGPEVAKVARCEGCTAEMCEALRVAKEALNPSSPSSSAGGNDAD